MPECWNLERHEKHVDEQQIEDLNCTAAKLVLDMGYEQGDVENAIKFAREKYGKRLLIHVLTSKDVCLAFICTI